MSDDLPITKNGVRVWQGISAAATTLAVSAILWGFSQFWTISQEMAKLNKLPDSVEQLRSRDETFSHDLVIRRDIFEKELGNVRSDLSGIRASLDQMLYRINRMEERKK